MGRHGISIASDDHGHVVGSHSFRNYLWDELFRGKMVVLELQDVVDGLLWSIGRDGRYLDIRQDPELILEPLDKLRLRFCVHVPCQEHLFLSPIGH